MIKTNKTTHHILRLLAAGILIMSVVLNDIPAIRVLLMALILLKVADHD